MEAYYIYTGLFIGAILLVALPIVVKDSTGAEELEDVEPYGIFELFNSVLSYVLSFIFGLLKVFTTSSIDDSIDTLQIDLESFFNEMAKMYTLIPIPLFLIIFVPFTGAMLYAIVKAFPTT